MNLTVIPAKAGIQSKYASEGQNIFYVACFASHDVFALDSGLRRNDGEVSLTHHYSPSSITGALLKGLASISTYD